MGCASSSAMENKGKQKTTPGKGYCIGFIDFIKPPPEFVANYAGKAPGTLAPYGGKFICKHALVPQMAEKMGHKKADVYGEPGQLAFIIEFPSFDQAVKWYNSPEYAKIVPVRNLHANFRMAVVEGEGTCANSDENTGYAFGFVDFIKPPEEVMANYATLVPGTFAPYGGNFICRHALAAPIAEKMGHKKAETFGEPGQMAYITQFKTFEDATKWYNSAEYQKIVPARNEHAAFRMAVVEGQAGAETAVNPSEKAGIMKGVTSALSPGRPCIHVVWKVPASEEKAMDAFWKEHEEWMRATHVMGDVAGDKPRLLHFYIAKGPEMKDPLNPTPEPTGDLLYIMSESYIAGEDIAKHMEKCGKEKGEWMKQMMAYHGKYGQHMDMGTTTNFTALSDNQQPSIYQPGDPCIHVVWRVPASEEKNMDTFWKEHEEWMRASHVQARDGDDSVKPRLTSFNIRKGPEMKDPLAPTPEPTGNLLYIMSESYAAAAGIAKHMELGNKDKPEWFKQMMEYNGKYGTHMDIGSSQVFTYLGC